MSKQSFNRGEVLTAQKMNALSDRIEGGRVNSGGVRSNDGVTPLKSGMPRALSDEIIYEATAGAVEVGTALEPPHYWSVTVKEVALDGSLGDKVLTFRAIGDPATTISPISVGDRCAVMITGDNREVVVAIGDDYPNRVGLTSDGKLTIRNAIWMFQDWGVSDKPLSNYESWTHTSGVTADVDIWWAYPSAFVGLGDFLVLPSGNQPDSSGREYMVHVASVRQVGVTGEYAIQNHVTGIMDATIPNVWQYYQKPAFMLIEQQYASIGGHQKVRYGMQVLTFQKIDVVTDVDFATEGQTKETILALTGIEGVALPDTLEAIILQKKNAP